MTENNVPMAEEERPLQFDRDSFDSLVANWAAPDDRRQRLWKDLNDIAGTIQQQLSGVSWRTVPAGMLDSFLRDGETHRRWRQEFLPEDVQVTEEERDRYYLYGLIELGIDGAAAGDDFRPRTVILAQGAPEISPDDLPLAPALRAATALAVLGPVTAELRRRTAERS